MRSRVASIRWIGKRQWIVIVGLLIAEVLVGVGIARSQGCVDPYIVQRGDTLSRIAVRCGVSVQFLISRNRLTNPNLIFIGQRLYLSSGGNISSLPTPGKTNTAKGLAMAVYVPDDLQRLGVSWYYQWGWCDAPGCVPMVYNMEISSACPPILLVGNEPNARPPYGPTITPQDAAKRTLAIERMCPQTKIIMPIRSMYIIATLFEFHIPFHIGEIIPNASISFDRNFIHDLKHTIRCFCPRISG